MGQLQPEFVLRQYPLHSPQNQRDQTSSGEIVASAVCWSISPSASAPVHQDPKLCPGFGWGFSFVDSHGFCNSSGSLAIFAAIRRALSLVSN